MPTPAKHPRWITPTVTLLLLTTCLGGCPLETTPPSAADLIGFNVDDPPTPVISSGPTLFESELLFESLPGKTGHHAPTLTALADGALLVAWYSYAGPGELDDADIYTLRRAPSSATWSEAHRVIDHAVSVGNPVLYAEDDRVWLFHAVVPGSGWSVAHIEALQSLDAGANWSAPSIVSAQLGSNVRYPPLRLPDGTLLLPAYDDLFQRSLFFASRDGDAWTLRSTLPPRLLNPAVQPSLALTTDNRLLATLRNGGTGWLWVTQSHDGGTSWTSPADTHLPNPGSPAALARLASGHLILVYNDSNAARRPLVASLSADDGRTWHPPRILVTGPGQYAYPAVAQAPDGLIHVVYSHDRATIGLITLNEAWLATPDP